MEYILLSFTQHGQPNQYSTGPSRALTKAASVPKRMAFLISEQSLDPSISSASGSPGRPRLASTIEAGISCAS